MARSLVTELSFNENAFPRGGSLSLLSRRKDKPLTQHAHTSTLARVISLFLLFSKFYAYLRVALNFSAVVSFYEFLLSYFHIIVRKIDPWKRHCYKMHGFPILRSRNKNLLRRKMNEICRKIETNYSDNSAIHPLSSTWDDFMYEK